MCVYHYINRVGGIYACKSVKHRHYTTLVLKIRQYNFLIGLNSLFFQGN